jgi:alpha-tubulin suppressor-like RCC1 family protein
VHAFDGTVSEPIAGSAVAAVSLGDTRTASLNTDPSTSSAADDSVSFVSLQPGALPDADSVRIVNLTSGASVSVLVYDGGFDPVAVQAVVGDTLEITPFKANMPQPALRAYVPPRLPPIVVRTNPPHRKTKVPLNASLVIVFSEPIAAGTASAANVRLTKDTVPVPADVRLDPVGLRAEIDPEIPLLPATEYRLLIETGIADLAGDSLEQRAEVVFTTIEATLSIAPQDASIAVGVQLQLTARLVNASGGVERLPPVTWSSSDANVAVVSTTGAVTGLAGGAVTIRASIEGQEATTTVAVVPPSGATMLSLTAGGNHSCGLTAAGSAYCWGSNEYGQLGDGAGGAGISQLRPVEVIGGHSFTMLAAGSHHTCGLTESGTVLCWGRNDQGQLGDGSQVSRDLPAPTAATDGYVAITAGLDHTCARTSAGVYCWGDNAREVFGGWRMSTTPVLVETAGGLTWAPIDFQARRDTSSTHWCPLIVNGGALFCWGQPPEGRAALDLATLSLPIDQGMFPRIVDVSLDAVTTCTVTVGGGASCIRQFAQGDYDFEHENGLGVEVGRAVLGFDVSYWYLEGHPYPGQEFSFPSGTGIVVSGLLHSCALTPDGEAHCWGAADRGQVGRPVVETDLSSDPRWQEAVAAPDPVEGSLRFATLAAGEWHTCGVTWSGETYCWGANTSGQLGDGTQADRDAPVQVNFQE